MGLTKLLVANRGEIAVRIMRAARTLGYGTVAVYSTADADAPHVAAADEAVAIGPPAARESYLNVERILDAARRTGADAIHPGYGFLAENASFASACEEAGVCFVGPPAQAIALMGDKTRSRERMREAGVPVVPGYDGADQSESAFAAAAERTGFPLLVKAAAGGGGRGMRRVDAPAELSCALESARAEALSAFGHGSLLLERLMEGVRHVEVQILADGHGNVIHLGERDCSTQRRYQKVLEECPSPAVDAQLRARMGQTAVAAARAIGYRNAGTVELLLGQGGGFWFLEMNTRLQVEHPVTEAVTGLDIVALQLRIAAGERLPIRQEDVQIRGHAIEARLYAEDPFAGHVPRTGRVLAFGPPEGDGVRCDHAVRPGAEVGAWYDPMLGKIIASGEDREHARRRLVRALRETVFLGPRTNKGFLIRLLEHETFVSGRATTRWVEGTFPAESLRRPSASDDVLAAAAAFFVARTATGDAWRNSGVWNVPLPLVVDGDAARLLRISPLSEGGISVAFGGDAAPRAARVLSCDGPRARVEVAGIQYTARVAWDGDRLHIEMGGEQVLIEEDLPRGAAGPGGDRGVLTAPMAGVVTRVDVTPGERVEQGRRAVTLEAMKIETPVSCPAPGTVREVRVAPGDRVKRGQVLVVLSPDGTG